jgi:hypothetical protein
MSAEENAKNFWDTTRRERQNPRGHEAMAVPLRGEGEREGGGALPAGDGGHCGRRRRSPRLPGWRNWRLSEDECDCDGRPHALHDDVSIASENSKVVRIGCVRTNANTVTTTSGSQRARRTGPTKRCASLQTLRPACSSTMLDMP